MISHKNLHISLLLKLGLLDIPVNEEVDDKYGCIFIHIPKNAGISVSYALFNTNIGHRKIKYYKIYDQKRFEDYFKFTFVRNPWARFLSAYTFLRKGGRNIQDRKWAEENLYMFDNFESFTLSLNNKKFAKKVLKQQHFCPQYKYICDNDFNILVDFVGKVENINQDFIYVKNKLGIEADLEHLNKSNHASYKQYYTKETSKIIFDLYRKDIEFFGYTF